MHVPVSIPLDLCAIWKKSTFVSILQEGISDVQNCFIEIIKYKAKEDKVRIRVCL